MPNIKYKLIDPDGDFFKYCNALLDKFLNNEISYNEFYVRSSKGWFLREEQLKGVKYADKHKR